MNQNIGVNNGMVLANYAVSVTELKKNFSNIISEADGSIVVLNHNRAEAYLIPAAHYEVLLSRLEDLEDKQLVMERAHEKAIEVSVDNLYEQYLSHKAA